MNFSTLSFISNEAAMLNIGTTSWIKVTEIVKAEQTDTILCQLGGLHMLMSFLGGIGTLMSGFSIAKVL